MKLLHSINVDRYDAPALGLEGTDKMTLRLLSDDSTWIELGPGGYTPDHQHDDKERMVIMSGKGVIKMGAERKDVTPGDFIEVSNEAHQMINTGNETLAFMCFRNQR